VSHCAAAGQPCLNGGNCLDLFGTYSCTCVAGFGGTHCEQQDAVNDCRSGNECGGPSHGVCKDGFFGFTCTCNAGYGGTDCSQSEAGQQDPCMSNPCLNNGVCQHKWYGSDYAYTCQCPSQTFGTHCENVDSVNQCTSVECCPQGGSCMDLFNEAICTCHTGYTGTSCSSQNTLGVAMPVTGCAAGSAGNHDYSTPPPPPPPYTTPTAGMQCTTYSCQNAGECR